MKFAKGQIWKSMLNGLEVEIVNVGRWAEGLVTVKEAGSAEESKTVTLKGSDLRQWHKLKE